MSKIEVGRFAESLRRLLNLKSNEGPQDIAPEMNAVFVLENDRPEWGIHKGERWCRRTVNRALGAGFSSKIKFRNPANSGVIAVFHEITGALDSAGVVLIRLVQTAVDYSTAIAAAITIDTRAYQGAQVAALSSLVISSQATDAADANSGFWRGAWPANTTPFLPILSSAAGAPVAIVAPGYALEVQAETVAIGMIVNAVWRERGMTQAERVP